MSNLIFDMYANKSVYFILFDDTINLRSFIWIPIVITFTTFLIKLRERFAALNALLRFQTHYLGFRGILYDYLKISFIISLE